MDAMSVDTHLITRVSQFYFREARLLDERCFQQWIALVEQTIEYTMPTRYVPLPDPRLQQTEPYLAIDSELDRAQGGQGSPIRQDYYPQLMARVMRPYSVSAWAENPPPRTRRFISNIEVEKAAENEYRVFSNFQLFYSHNGAENHTYTGARRDMLRDVDGQFRLCKREIIIDWDIVTAPTLALIF